MIEYLHEARISVNERLPNPILDIVENNNLGKPLPNIRIPFQYIIILKYVTQHADENRCSQFKY